MQHTCAHPQTFVQAFDNFQLLSNATNKPASGKAVLHRYDQDKNPRPAVSYFTRKKEIMHSDKMQGDLSKSNLASRNVEVGEEIKGTNNDDLGTAKQDAVLLRQMTQLQLFEELKKDQNNTLFGNGKVARDAFRHFSTKEAEWLPLSAKASAHLPVPEALKHHAINGRWKCQKKIGSGSFGDIYTALLIDNGDKVAVKVESLKARHPQLIHEAKILSQMQGFAGFPEIYHYGIHMAQYTVVVMELLGPSLEELFCRWERRSFPLSTIGLIGTQIVDRLEALHSQGYIHRDVKPDNFLIGTGINADKIYCVDFGLSKRYRDSKTCAHIPYSNRRTLTGTARYASVNTHAGIEPGRRDDVISLFYTLLYFAKGGTLPWQGLKANTKEEKYHKIMEKKAKTSVEELTKGLPDAFRLCWNHLMGLKFSEEPNYGLLRTFFTSIAVDNFTSIVKSPTSVSGIWSPNNKGFNSRDCETADTVQKPFGELKGSAVYNLMMQFQDGIKRAFFQTKDPLPLFNLMHRGNQSANHCSGRGEMTPEGLKEGNVNSEKLSKSNLSIKGPNEGSSPTMRLRKGTAVNGRPNEENGATGRPHHDTTRLNEKKVAKRRLNTATPRLNEHRDTPRRLKGIIPVFPLRENLKGLPLRRPHGGDRAKRGRGIFCMTCAKKTHSISD